ncbi:MAG: hypothetical protein WA152_04400 [Microgenomates group bacterium]
MQKINIFILALCLWLASASSALAITPTISIQDLPSYVTTDNFKLSCSALGGSSAQFYFKKEGGLYQSFGSAIDLNSNPCQIQVNSSQINDQTKYYFKVTLDGGVSDETNTTYDFAGPLPVSGYKKDDGGNNTIVIHWRNPESEDLAKIIIYRGDTVDFIADSNHEIATVVGNPNSDMTYSVNIPDTSKTYYYSLRAVDKAGNSSSLVGDGSSSITSTVITQNPSKNVSGAVTSLPKEDGSNGQVLGDEESSEENTVLATSSSLLEKITEKAPNNKGFYIGLGLVLLAIVLYRYFMLYKQGLPLRGKK